MGFFAEFNTWLDELLTNYIADTVFDVANALEPALVTCGMIYVMVWGYMHITGKIEEPFSDGLKRIILLATVFGVGLELWLYNAVIIDTLFNAPGQLAAHIVGAYDAVSIVDNIISKGTEVAERLSAKFIVTSLNFSVLFAAGAVYVMIGLTAVYTIFLMSLARVALSVLLALGPLFIALFLFDGTRHIFKSWLGQMTTYAFVSLLTVMFAALMMYLVTKAADQAIAAGDTVTIAHGLRVCMGAGLGFLVMRQVMPIAAALGGGAAMSTFGVISGAARGVADKTKSSLKGAGLFANVARGKPFDAHRPSLSHRMGAYVGNKSRSLVQRGREMVRASRLSNTTPDPNWTLS